MTNWSSRHFCWFSVRKVCNFDPGFDLYTWKSGAPLHFSRALLGKKPLISLNNISKEHQTVSEAHKATSENYSFLLIVILLDFCQFWMKPKELIFKLRIFLVFFFKMIKIPIDLRTPQSHQLFLSPAIGSQFSLRIIMHKMALIHKWFSGLANKHWKKTLRNKLTCFIFVQLNCSGYAIRNYFEMVSVTAAYFDLETDGAFQRPINERWRPKRCITSPVNTSSSIATNQSTRGCQW